MPWNSVINFCSSRNVVRTIKRVGGRGMMWAGHVARMGRLRMMNGYK
jgi:hypothetical protein